MKHFLLILLIIIACIFFLLPLFHTGLYESHDGEAHVARFAAYYKAFQDGQFPPRWAGDLNSGYGSPLFIFFYPLPGYTASFLHFLGFNFEVTFKIVMGISFVLSPLFLFLWLRKSAKNVIALAVSVLYFLLPYRFLDIYIRGDIAEMMSFVFIPLIFLFIDKSIKDKKIGTVLVGGFFYSLFILSHNGIAVIFSPIFILYILFSLKELKNCIYPFAMFLFGIILTAFFWLPALSEGRFVYTNLFIDNVYKDNFLPLWKLFYSKWGYGADINMEGGQSPQIGILYSILPFLIILFIKKMAHKKELIFWFAIFIFAIFMTISYSYFIWQYAPIIRLMGYPWRFTALSGFAACMIIFYAIKDMQNRYVIFSFLALASIISLQFVKVKGYTHKNDYFYLSYQGTTDYHMRTSTIWAEGDFGKKPNKQLEIISGKGEITKFKKNSLIHTFDIDVKNDDVQLMDNTVYFRDWQAFIDGKKVAIEFQDQHHRGLITFRVPKGRHIVKIQFNESPIRLFSDIVSVIGIGLMILLLAIRKRIKNTFYI